MFTYYVGQKIGGGGGMSGLEKMNFMNFAKFNFFKDFPLNLSNLPPNLDHSKDKLDITSKISYS